MMPPGYKYSVEGSTPSYTGPEGVVIERDTEVRVRIKGLRGEIGNMFAIGSIKEDYLGCVEDIVIWNQRARPLTSRCVLQGTIRSGMRRFYQLTAKCVWLIELLVYLQRDGKGILARRSREQKKAAGRSIGCGVALRDTQMKRGRRDIILQQPIWKRMEFLYQSGDLLPTSPLTSSPHPSESPWDAHCPRSSPQHRRPRYPSSPPPPPLDSPADPTKDYTAPRPQTPSPSR